MKVYKARIIEKDGDRHDLGVFSSKEKAKERLDVEIKKDKKSMFGYHPDNYTLYEVVELTVDDLNYNPYKTPVVFTIRQSDIPNFSTRHLRQVSEIIEETISEKYTCTEKSWEDMMEDLSSSINKPIILDDAGNYNVCDCEPFHISIRPIVHDIFDVVSYKDGTDRTKILYIKFKELKEFVKNYLSDNSPNYVDCAYDKVCVNSKDKEGGKSSNDAEKDISVNSEGSPITSESSKNMNKEEDNPDEPMRDVGNFKKMKDYPETKPKYTVPKLDKKLKGLVVKYGKRSKGRPRK